jgi:hypothetical protein
MLKDMVNHSISYFVPKAIELGIIDNRRNWRWFGKSYHDKLQTQNAKYEKTGDEAEAEAEAELSLKHHQNHEIFLNYWELRRV